MKISELVMLFQRAMNRSGERLTEDGDFGPVSQSKADKYNFTITATPKAVPETPPPPVTGSSGNPAYNEAKKYAGKKETDKGFSAWLSAWWAKVGLKSYVTKGIAGASLAWCALFFFTMNSEVGQKVVASAGAADIGRSSGFEINWKRDGIPQGAGVWKNSSSCGSGSGNHITWADGDCSAADLAKAKATWPGFGGNQNNEVKRSIYCAKGDCSGSKDVICRVFWHVKTLPPPVKTSKNCSGSSSAETTR